MYYTYVITDLNTGSYYVGSTGELDKRLDRHERELCKGAHHNQLLQKLHDEGHELRVSTHEFDSREEAYKCEDYLIRRGTCNRKCINIGTSAIGGDNLTKHPNREDIISRRGESIKLRMGLMSVEERNLTYGRVGAANGMFGRTHPDEVRARISLQHTGNSYAKGVIRSEETKRLLSDNASKRTGELNPFFGRHHTPETCAKIAEARKGILPVNTLSVVIDGVVYHSMTEAGRQLGIPVPTVHYRIKSKNPKFSGYELR